MDNETKNKAPLFKKIAERYLRKPTKYGLPKSETSVRNIRWMINYFDGKLISDIKRADITDLREHLLYERQLKSSTVNTYTTYLRAILHYARDELEVVDTIPKIVSLEENQKELVLSHQQLRDFLHVVDELRYDMIKFDIHVGQRNANVRLMRWDELDEKYKFWTIKSVYQKNKKPLIIPINRDARKILKLRWKKKLKLQEDKPELKEIEHVFFQDNGKPFSRSGLVNKTWRSYVKKARLPQGTTFHTLRHMFATLHIEHGTDQSELMAVGGWLNTRSVQRYLHIRNKHKGNVAQRLEGVVAY